MKEERLVLLYSKEEIAQKVTNLADQISKDYDDKEVILICILKGAFTLSETSGCRLRLTSSGLPAMDHKPGHQEA